MAPIYVGSTKVNPAGLSKVYVGSSLVWQKGGAAEPYFRITINGSYTSSQITEPAFATYFPAAVVNPAPIRTTYIPGFDILHGQKITASMLHAQAALIADGTNPLNAYAFTMNLGGGIKCRVSINGEQVYDTGAGGTWWTALNFGDSFSTVSNGLAQCGFCTGVREIVIDIY